MKDRAPAHVSVGVLRQIRRNTFAAEHCFVVEDTASGVQAAKAGGMLDWAGPVSAEVARTIRLRT